MRTRLSRAEKWLFATPIAIIGLAAVFLTIKKGTTTEFLDTPLPVIEAHFLPNEEMLVMLQPDRKVGQFYPTVAIYDLPSEKQINSVDLLKQIYKRESHISADGKYWLAEEYSEDFETGKMVLRGLPSLKVIRTFSLSSGNWIDNRRFYLSRPKGQGREVWTIGNNGELSHEVIESQPETVLSPDGKWAVKYWNGKNIHVDEFPAYSRDKGWSYLPQSEFLVSEPDHKIHFKLPGDSWLGSSWAPGGQQLRGVAALEEVFPQRGDILTFDMATRKVTATQLEIPDWRKGFNLILRYLNFKFSPDHRALATCSYDGSFLLWETKTGKLLKFYGSDFRDSFSPSDVPEFSSDSKRVLRLTRKGVEIYRLDQLLPR